LESYRSHWVNVDVEKDILEKGPLRCKVMTVGAPEYISSIGLVKNPH
jgi:hypothetical protein